MTRFVTILTGPIGSGKTTTLSEWVGDQTARGARVAGILAPVVAGERTLCSIESGECRRLAAQGDLVADPELAEERVVAIGPHRFDGDVFAWARGILAAAAALDWLVIDEVGPLELRGEGLEPGLGAILRAAPGPGRIILVVRHTLVDRVVAHYTLGATLEAVVSTDSLADWSASRAGA